jgi:hypothetical protein
MNGETLGKAPLEVDVSNRAEKENPDRDAEDRLGLVILAAMVDPVTKKFPEGDAEMAAAKERILSVTAVFRDYRSDQHAFYWAVDNRWINSLAFRAALGNIKLVESEATSFMPPPPAQESRAVVTLTLGTTP